MSDTVSLRETMVSLRNLGIEGLYNPEYIQYVVNDSVDDEDNFDAIVLDAEAEEYDDCYLPIDIEFDEVTEMTLADRDNRSATDYSRLMFNDCTAMLVANDIGVFECRDILYGNTNRDVARISRKLGFMSTLDWVKGAAELNGQLSETSQAMSLIGQQEMLEMIDDINDLSLEESRAMYGIALASARSLYALGDINGALILMKLTAEKANMDVDCEVFTTREQLTRLLVDYSTSEVGRHVGFWLPFPLEELTSTDKPQRFSLFR